MGINTGVSKDVCILVGVYFWGEVEEVVVLFVVFFDYFADVEGRPIYIKQVLPFLFCID